MAWRGWLAAAAVLIAVAGAFLAGRLSRDSAPPAVVAQATPDASAIRERVVLADLGDHLDRTERALTEFVNASDAYDTAAASAAESVAAHVCEWAIASARSTSWPLFRSSR